MNENIPGSNFSILITDSVIPGWERDIPNGPYVLAPADGRIIELAAYEQPIIKVVAQVKTG